MLRKFLSATTYSCICRRKLYSGPTRLVYAKELRANAYQPYNVEKDKYEKWEKEGLFSPSFPQLNYNFGMILPPPNVTGKLHLGHALGCTIQDVINRRNRSRGYNVLWVPGTDHAGIATQGVVEKYIKNTKNLTRQEMGKEMFHRAVLKWKEEHGNTIRDQLKKLGCSLDWSREMFTMDTNHTLAVNHAFKELYRKKLIYRKKALVNWSTTLQSTVSDIEVEHVPVKPGTLVKVNGYAKPVEMGKLYSFAYKIMGSNQDLIVSTTMPETMLGDVAVAVHPDDERYTHLIKKRVYHPFRQTSIPVIFDRAVDMNFGTGAVKITPAHNKTDYEIAQRHKLEMRQVIDERGIIINSDDFGGLNKYRCREQIVNRLDNMGFLKHITPHEMVLPICSRSGDIIEYLPKEQWFLSCKEMNDKARDAVAQGKLQIEPSKFLQNWAQWINDNKDWCISRQLWWGHQIPAFACSINNHTVWVPAISESEAQKEAGLLLRVNPKDIVAKRDPDVLDTWFSSGVYPFSALGWPKKTQEMSTFYPLSLMVTGHDILGFWVHRMVMLGLELTNTLPFNRVLLHGIICDNKGAKMSKSRGNVIDPLDVIQGISLNDLNNKTMEMRRNGILTDKELEKALQYQKVNFSNTNGIPECGVDALRFTLLSQDVRSHFVNFDVSMCHANKLFCNKIWQAVKFTKMNVNNLRYNPEGVTSDDLTYFDRWILSRMSDMVAAVNKYIDNNEFHLATKSLRTFLYNELCDVYIESTKSGFGDNNIKMSYAHAHTLSAVLNTGLRCLHPFMIYLTDELLPQIPDLFNNIIYNYNDADLRYYAFPQPADFEKWKDHEVESRVGRILDTVSLARELKSMAGMSSAYRPTLSVKTSNEKFKLDLMNNLAVLLNLSKCGTLEFSQMNDDLYKEQKFVRGVLDSDAEIGIEVLGTEFNIAMMTIRSRLENKIEKLSQSIKKLEEKFATAKYTESNVFDHDKLERKREQLRKLKIDLSRLPEETPEAENTIMTPKVGINIGEDHNKLYRD